MSWAFVQRAKMMRTPWGSFKVWAWDLWTAWIALFDIHVSDMPKSWRKGT